MPMTVVVTRNVSNRVRGLLASSMLEMAPGVYSAPKLSPTVRARIWNVLEEWFPAEKNASVIMLWAESGQAGGQATRMLGLPPVTLVDVDGMLLGRRAAK